MRYDIQTCGMKMLAAYYFSIFTVSSLNPETTDLQLPKHFQWILYKFSISFMD